jgi:hypothetical protein
MKKEVYFAIICSIAGLIIGDLAILYGYIGFGFLIMTLDLISMMLVFIFVPELNIKNIFQGITLLILLQLISFSVPQQFFTDTIIQYILIYTMMLIPIYHMIEDRVSSSAFFYILILVLLTGMIVEIFQYMIFKANPLDISYINKISGEFSVLCIVSSLLVAMSLMGTRYCTKKISDLIGMIVDSLFTVLIVTLVFNVTSIQ